MSICYLNGSYLNIEEAKISPLDRGFTFGDSIYEVIACYKKKPFKLKLHIDRLLKNLNSIKIDMNIDGFDITEIIEQVIEKNDHENQVIYLQISRGFEHIRNHSPIENLKPTIFISSFPMMSIPEVGQKPIEAILLDDFRWKRSNIKATSLLASVLYKIEAKEKNVTEVILHEDGFITEGSISNIFCVKDQMIKTPSLESNILPGVTRKVLLEIIKNNNFNFEETDVSKDDLFSSDEVWMTNTTKGIIPISKINQNYIVNEASEPLYERILELFINEISADRIQ
ncbi:MAG: aminotransferase class IV [Gammaproteobacteria bacterium]